MKVNPSHSDFYWTNRKRQIERIIAAGLKIRLRLHDIADGLSELQASVHGLDMSDRQHTTGWYEIGKLFDGIERWHGGLLTQYAMPDVTREDREFIKTGMSPKDWQETFGDDD